MRVVLLAMLLTGCGSACSATTEQAPGPVVPTEPPAGGAPPAAAAEPAPAVEPEPEPEPQPLDADDLRVVYISASSRPRVRFVPAGEQLVVVDAADVAAGSDGTDGTDGTDHKGADTGEVLRVVDTHGKVAWERAFKGIDDVAADETDVFVLADGALSRHPLDGSEPTRLADGHGQVFVVDDQVYVHTLGLVTRVPKSGGTLEKVTKSHERAGFFTAQVGAERIVLLASAFRNRPARLPKVGWVYAAPRAGGPFKLRTNGVHSPGPDLAVEGQWAYFGASLSASEFAYRIYRSKLVGSPRPELVVKHPIGVFEVDGEWLYASAHLDGGPGIYRFPVAGGEAERISEFADGATQVETDTAHVYWESRGRIYRVEK